MSAVHPHLCRDPTNTFVRDRRERPIARDETRSIFECRDRSTGGLSCWFVYGYDPNVAEQADLASRRADFLRSLRHPNVATQRVVWVNRAKGEVNSICEFSPAGTLRDHRKTLHASPTMAQTHNLAMDVLSALDYLHAREPRVLYRNLRSDSVLVAAPGSFKLFDFSLAVRSSDDSAVAVTAVGSTAYMAPEIFEVFSGARPAYDAAADVYAFGMLLAEWYTGKRPYEECVNPAQILRQCARGMPPRMISEIGDKYLREVIIACTARNPADRPGVNELLADFGGQSIDD